MKKLASLLASVCIFFACGESTTNDESTADTASVQSESAAPDTSSTSSAMVKDGVMAMKDGKMMVMKGGNWEPMTEDVTTTNGRKVSTTGEVTKGDRKRKLEEGMMIDKDGQLMDKDGKMMDNTGWE